MPFESGKPVRRVWLTVANLDVIRRYGLALAVVLAATGLRLACNPVFGVQAPHMPFALAVIVAARFGGRGPGLAATALSGLSVDWFFVEPRYSFAITDPDAIGVFALFLVTGSLIALLVGSLRESLRTLAKTEESLRRQAQLIDLSHDAVITMDSQRRVITWNKGAEEMYGWREQDAAGKPLHELLRTVAPIPFPEIDEILRRERRWEGEVRQTDRDGRHLLVDSRQVLLGGGNGSPARILAIGRNITERKQIEEALRASQMRFEFVLEAAKVGAWDLDPDSHAAWRSPQHDAIFGYPGQLPEWTYQTFLNHVLPEDRDAADSLSRQAIAKGGDLEYECRIRRADGVIRWIWVRGRSQLDPEGRPLRLSGIVRDVTSRKKTEDDLRESEDRFRTLANAIPQLCGMADANGWFVWVNQRWYDYTGLTSEQTQGWGWLSAINPEVLGEVRERWRYSIASGEPFESVFELRRADGAASPFLARAVPVRDREGRSVVHWVGTMTDISEQRKTEDALRKAHCEELAHSKELEAIMDAVPVAMFVARDAECRNIIGNRAAYTLLRERPGSNLSKSAPAGERLPVFRLMKNGVELSPWELPLQRAAATGQSVFDLELELAFEDGSRGDILGNAVPFLDAEGRSHGSVGVFVDITERKQNEERLRQAQKLESIGLLAGGIAHDFNNLLTVIIGYADSARRRYPSIEEIQHIIGASERAAQLTRQLLAYAGKGQFVARTFNLSDLVSNSAQLLSASIAKGAQLVFHLSEQELPIKADPSQVEQIIVNLVINAREAISPATEGRIEIATSACEVTPDAVRGYAPESNARPGRFVCLEVTDNGTGMDEATLARIFDPFFSTKFTGRGLGLAAVQGIVRSCGGFIEVRSSMGAGSTFRVFLQAAERTTAEVPAGSHKTVSQCQDRRHAAVLVADDDEMVRQLACTVLRSCGYEVLEAKNGRETLEVLAGADPLPSLVLLDMTMPVMGGQELVPILNQKYAHLQIIVTSGYAEEDVQRRFPPGAVTGFLQKPYTVAALSEKVEETLRRGGDR